jgi:hypothetical protein
MRALIALVLAHVAAAQAYYVVQVPDTQHYGNNLQRYWHWPLSCLTLRSLPWPPAYVAHMGDFTQDALDAQFERGLDAMALLGSIPWGASIGNHDYDAGRKCTRSGGPCSTQWQRWMGPENFARTVQTAAGPVLFLHLEYLPSDAAIELARAAMDAAPTTPAALVTHYYLDRDGTANSNYGAQLDNDGDNSPVQLRRKLIDPYPQLFLVLCGHVSTTANAEYGSPFGTRVLSFLFDCQDDPDGGQGFTRLLVVEPAVLHVATYSVSFTGRPPDRSEYWQLPYDSAGHRASLRPVQRLEPVADTSLRSLYGGGRVLGAEDTLYAESTSGNQAAVLLRFDVAPGPVERALLTVTCEGYGADGDGFTVHRMLLPFDESESWASRGGFVAGRDYEAAPAAVVGPHGPETLSVDVTDVVRAGAPHGLTLVGRGGSSGIRSREWRARAERPLLSVR